MKGRVTLLGAGPGDPELLTLIGKRRLNEADVVLYDRLIDPSLLVFTNAKAKLIDVGKFPHYHKVKQTRINQLLIQYAQAGKRVVRLKAGDPYVFGRGGEEAQALKKEGIDFEVVPGTTSAIAGLAAVGIPITHRDFASSFHVITGHHKKDSQKELDWPNLAHQEGTQVFLMGMARLRTICQQLIAHGKDPQTPVAIIQWATQWRQKLAIGNLTDISEIVKRKGLSSPALIVIGNVVKLSRELNVQRPLQNVHVLIPYSRCHRLRDRLVDQGATVDFYKRVSKDPVAVDLTILDRASVLLVDSIAAYKEFIKQLVASGRDLRSLAHLKIIAQNHLVALYLQSAGLLVDGTLLDFKMPSDFAEIGGEQAILKGGTFLQLYRKSKAKPALPFNLNEFNAVVFPSQDSVIDFNDCLTKQQRQQLRGVKAFVMGAKIEALAAKLNFKKIIVCQRSFAQTVKSIKEEFNYG